MHLDLATNLAPSAPSDRSIPPPYMTVNPSSKPIVTISPDFSTGHALVSVLPPDHPRVPSGQHVGKRSAIDICCVIDVSSSMSVEAVIRADPTSGADTESSGLSVLDVVKHALRTIITTMQEDDRLALVTFSNSARTMAPLTRMNAAGKAHVLSTISRLKTNRCTNLWDGLKVGMGVLLDSVAPAPVTPSSGRISTLFLLTDGMPNVVPPRGHIAMLKEYLETHCNELGNFSINTFGFGYHMDSSLLLEIARLSAGGYGFVPDCGMVGTVFVHAVANTYATYAPRAKLSIEVPEGTEVQVKGGLVVEKASWGVQIDIGDLQFAQSMDVVLVFRQIPETIRATLTYSPPAQSSHQQVHAQFSGFPDPSLAPSDLATLGFHVARLDFVEALYSSNAKNLPHLAKRLQELSKAITTSPYLANYSDALDLAKDISSEGALALEPSNYRRWGRHYLPSLARSHERQQCANFKDPGLQIYGRHSRIFIEERNKLDTAFDNLPPPEPSIAIPAAPGTFSIVNIPPPAGSPQGAPTTRKLYSGSGSMSSYRMSSRPCFAGDCLITLGSGKEVKVAELKRGMHVMTMNGPRVVGAVVKTAISSGEALLCRVGHLKVTPWHPIVSPLDKTKTKWVFPADVVAPESMACNAVYSVFLLRLPSTARGGDHDAHSVSISGVWCVTLGHGLTRSESGDVRAHPFLGDYGKVLRCLAGLEGFHGDDGVVKCIGTRRDRNGMVCEFVGEAVVPGSGRFARRLSQAQVYG